MKYAVCEIKGRQYLVRPSDEIEVNKLEEGIKVFDADKVLLVVDDKVELGRPYLDKKLKFEVVGTRLTPKIRVATYKAKANYRRVVGSRSKLSRIRLAA